MKNALKIPIVPRTANWTILGLVIFINVEKSKPVTIEKRENKPNLKYMYKIAKNINNELTRVYKNSMYADLIFRPREP